MNLYLGFEFAPVEGWEHIMPSPQAPSNYKDPVKIQAYVEKAIDKLRDGKAAIDPLCGTIKRAVVLRVVKKEIEKVLDTADNGEEPGTQLCCHFGKGMLSVLRDVGVLAGYKIHRAMRLAVIEAIAAGWPVSREELWMLDADPDFRYNRMPGYVDPVSLIFGSSDVDLIAVARRMGLQPPKDDAESMATFAVALMDRIVTTPGV